MRKLKNDIDNEDKKKLKKDNQKNKSISSKNKIVKDKKKKKIDKKNVDKLSNSKVKKVKNFGLKDRIYYVILGFILCIICLFVCCRGQNYFKMYYELKEFIDIYDAVTNDYYKDLDKDKLVNSAIDSMLFDIEDSYTTYVNKEATDTFLENVNGTYEGIGCMISTDLEGNIVIVEVFDDSPSSKAGLKANDIILKANGKSFADSLELSEYIKTGSFSKIVLNIKREDKDLEITIKREKIDIPVVSSEIFEYSGKKIGYISIEIFSSVSYEQIKSKLNKLEKKGIDGLVVDVRDNNGGYLNAVTDIASLFLKKGKVIYQLEDNKDKEKIKDETKEYRDYPVAVLINGGSASASEIFAATIKESYGGFVVGVNSYGKGTVQKTKMLKNGGMVKYTVQKWLTPKGEFINEIGVIPTNVVEYNYELGYDNQLDEAMKLVSMIDFN